MNEERKKWALQWMYDHLSHKWFGLAVLDKTKNSDSSLTESYSNTEIHALFETLRIEGYIFPVVNQYGQPCFILNEMKELEWRDKIEDTAPTRGRIVGKHTKAGFFYFLRELGVGLSGGIIAIIVGKLLGIL